MCLNVSSIFIYLYASHRKATCTVSLTDTKTERSQGKHDEIIIFTICFSVNCAGKHSSIAFFLLGEKRLFVFLRTYTHHYAMHIGLTKNYYHITIENNTRVLLILPTSNLS